MAGAVGVSRSSSPLLRSIGRANGDDVEAEGPWVHIRDPQRRRPLVEHEQVLPLPQTAVSGAAVQIPASFRCCARGSVSSRGDPAGGNGSVLPSCFERIVQLLVREACAPVVGLGDGKFRARSVDKRLQRYKGCVAQSTVGDDVYAALVRVFIRPGATQFGCQLFMLHLVGLCLSAGHLQLHHRDPKPVNCWTEAGAGVGGDRLTSLFAELRDVRYRLRFSFRRRGSQYVVVLRRVLCIPQPSLGPLHPRSLVVVSPPFSASFFSSTLVMGGFSTSSLSTSPSSTTTSRACVVVSLTHFWSVFQPKGWS